jgi:hypothetical protein
MPRYRQTTSVAATRRRPQTGLVGSVSVKNPVAVRCGTEAIRGRAEGGPMAPMGLKFLGERLRVSRAKFFEKFLKSGIFFVTTKNLNLVLAEKFLETC